MALCRRFGVTPEPILPPLSGEWEEDLFLLTEEEWRAQEEAARAEREKAFKGVAEGLKRARPQRRRTPHPKFQAPAE